MFARITGQAAVGLAFLLGAAGACTAGSFAVSPVRATLSSSQRVGSMVVRNTGAEPVVVQLEAFDWSQQEGQDVYTATKEILATPPIFTIPPGGSQIVRVGLRRAPDPQRELTYRLYLQEVPSAKPDLQGLRVVLRMGVPVFVAPAVAAAPVLRWHAARHAGNTLKLSLTNNGNAHIQIAKSKLTLADTTHAVATQEVAAYVLPGQTRDWLVKASALPPPGAALRVFAQTDSGDMQAEVVVD